jgi:hypothetical protein
VRAAPLTSAQVARLADLTRLTLRTLPLPAPAVGESEPSYTARCLHQAIEILVKNIGIRGLRATGERLAPVRTVHFLGLRFYPDLAIMYREWPIIAIEVKYLGGRHSQTALATAIGQATIYRLGGYLRSFVLLIDQRGHSSDDSPYSQDDVIVRKTRGGILLPNEEDL